MPARPSAAAVPEASLTSLPRIPNFNSLVSVRSVVPVIPSKREESFLLRILKISP